MRRWVVFVGGAAGIAALGAMGGCEMASVVAMNLIDTTKFTVDDTTLYMNGEINAETRDQFEAVYAANPQITTVVECDVPGSLDDDTMISLSYRVRELGLSTHLTGSSHIASGGVDFFLAGVNRTMEDGARIGVHSWSDGVRDAADYPKDSPEHDANAGYIADMLGDDAFYWFTIYAAPAAEMMYMSTDQIAEYGLLTAPVMTSSEFTCPA